MPLPALLALPRRRQAAMRIRRDKATAAVLWLLQSSRDTQWHLDAARAQAPGCQIRWGQISRVYKCLCGWLARDGNDPQPSQWQKKKRTQYAGNVICFPWKAPASTSTSGLSLCIKSGLEKLVARSHSSLRLLLQFSFLWFVLPFGIPRSWKNNNNKKCLS